MDKKTLAVTLVMHAAIALVAGSAVLSAQLHSGRLDDAHGWCVPGLDRTAAPRGNSLLPHHYHSIGIAVDTSSTSFGLDTQSEMQRHALDTLSIANTGDLSRTPSVNSASLDLVAETVETDMVLWIDYGYQPASSGVADTAAAIHGNSDPACDDQYFPCSGDGIFRYQVEQTFSL